MVPSKTDMRSLTSIAFFTGLMLLFLFFAGESALAAKAESPVIDSPWDEGALPIRAISAGDSGVSQPTGLAVMLLSRLDIGGPIPNDLPFGRNVRVWDDPNEQSRPSLAVNATGTILLAFQHFNGADWDIYATASTDDGHTWASPIVLAATSANETNPSLAVNSRGAFALFYEQDEFADRMYFFHSADGILWQQGYWIVKTGLSNPRFPSVAAENPVGNYPDGIMVIVQVRCEHPTNCVGGSDTAYWVGARYWSTWPPAFDLANWYWGAGLGGVPPQLIHPSISWTNVALYQAMENVTTPDANWSLVTFTMFENGSGLYRFYYSQVNSTANIFPRCASDGINVLIGGSYVNATLFPSNPVNHNAMYFFSMNAGAGYAVGPMDPSVTDQQSVSVAGEGSEWHFSYYSDLAMTHQVSLDSMATLSGPQKASDNSGTAVNDNRSTSIFLAGDGVPKVAWQDNRDADVNIYFATNLTHRYWINASCGGVDADLNIQIDGSISRTPVTGYWVPGSNHIIEVTEVDQMIGACKRCVFAQWSTGGQAPLVISADGEIRIEAQFDETYHVQLNPVPASPLLSVTWNGTDYQGITEIFEKPGTYVASVRTPQQTAPDIRYNFTRWSDGVMSPSRDVDVPGPGEGCVDLTVEFQTEYMIAISSNPIGLFVGYDGISGRSPLSFWAAAGSQHILNTSSFQSDPGGNPDMRYRFNLWISGPSTLTLTIIADGPAVYIADFIEQYRMRIMSNIPGPLFNVTTADCGIGLPAPGPLICWADEGTNPIIEAISPPLIRCRFSFLTWDDGYPFPIRSALPSPPNATYLAIFEFQCSITIDIDPFSCWDAGPPVATWHPFGERVLILWSPPTGLPPYERYRFAGWVGNGGGNFTGPDPVANVTILDDITETAFCFHEFKLTVDSGPEIFYFVDNVNCTGLQEFWWLNRTTHWLNVTVTTQMSSVAGTRFVFYQWSGVDISTLPHHPPIVVSSSTAGLYLTEFRTQYLITLLSPDWGGPRCIERVDCWYDANSPATINITTPWPSGTPFIRYAFQSWSGDATGTEANLPVASVTSPMTIVANWAEEYKLSVSTEYSSHICSPDEECWFIKDGSAYVTLTETIVPGATGTRYVFAGWTDDASGSNPFPLTMDSPKNITALWKTQYLLTVLSSCGTDSVCGSPKGGGWFNGSDIATVTVVSPYSDTSGKVWDFDRWSGDASGSQSTAAVIMDGSKNVTALWKEHPSEQGLGSLVVWIAILAVAIISIVIIMLVLKRRKGRKVEESHSESSQYENR